MAGLLCSLALVLCLFGCPGEPDMPPTPPAAKLASLSVSPSAATIRSGDEVELTANFTMESGTENQLTWHWTAEPSGAVYMNDYYPKTTVSLESDYSGNPGDTITVTCSAGGKTASATLTVGGGNVVTLDLNGGSSRSGDLISSTAYGTANGTHFNGSGKSPYTVFTASKLTGTEINLPLKSDMTGLRLGYNFKGWGTTADATTVAYAAYQPYTEEESITLYAIWEPSTYTQYQYVVNKENIDGSYENNYPRTEHGTTGEAIDVASLYASMDLSGFELESVTPANPVIAADGSTSVEIKFKRKMYTLTFDANGGKFTTPGETGTRQLKYGAEMPAVTAFPAVTHETLDFDKWTMAGSSADLQIGATPTITGDTEIKANWIDIAPADAGSGFVTFGYGPQTVKKADVTIRGLVEDGGFWNGYYKGSDGEYYLKMNAKPDGTGAKFSDGATAIESNKEYYFKVEPVKWKSFTDGSATRLIAEKILEAKVPFDSIDTFLSGAFKERAFGKSGAAKINGDITLPSSEMVTSAYGTIANAKLKETDYTMAKGIKWDPTYRDSTGGYWFLSDGASETTKATFIKPNGLNPMSAEEEKSSINAGIVPTLCITNN